MKKTFKIGHSYKDILSVSKEDDEFVSWFSHNGSGIGNSGGIRAAKYLKNKSLNPCYIILITRGISHRLHNPWEDTVDYSSGSIFYWGDAKFDKFKNYDDFRGNKHLKNIYEKVLDNDIFDMPPILHFSKTQTGRVQFNGLCVIEKLELTWYEDSNAPVKNYKCELSILDIQEIDVGWLHKRVDIENVNLLNKDAPKVWKNYINGNIKKLDLQSKSILSKSDQLPIENSNDTKILNELCNLTPTEFEAVVVELFSNLPHVHHYITRTRPNKDGGFDFYGRFTIPYPVKYEIGFLGEAKRFSRNNGVQPKHISRLVARLNRGQFGLFVTTSYYTKQSQEEVLVDGYPVKLFSGIDLINFLKELRLIENGKIKRDWIDSIKTIVENNLG